MNAATQTDDMQRPEATDCSALMPTAAAEPGRAAGPAKIAYAVLVAMTAVGVGGMLVARATAQGYYARPCLLVASTGYLLIAVVAGGLRSWYGRLILAALGFCWLGDYLGPDDFVLGLWLFLVAHFGLMAAFVNRGLPAKRCVISFAIVIMVGGGVFAWLYPHVPPGEYLPIFSYMVVITVMMGLAGGSTGGVTASLIVIGAAFFYISDVCLARSRFIGPDFVNTAIGYPLYYAACVLFGLSVLTDRDRTQQ
jgi:uncharacterized membrane protein YhhN